MEPHKIAVFINGVQSDCCMFADENAGLAIVGEVVAGGLGLKQNWKLIEGEIEVRFPGRED